MRDGSRATLGWGRRLFVVLCAGGSLVFSCSGSEATPRDTVLSFAADLDARDGDAAVRHLHPAFDQGTRAAIRALARVVKVYRLDLLKERTPSANRADVDVREHLSLVIGDEEVLPTTFSLALVGDRWKITAVSKLTGRRSPPPQK